MAGVSALFRGFGEGERSRRPPRAWQDDPGRALHRARDLEPREPQAARLLPLEQRVARRSPRLPYRSRGSRGSAQWQDHRPDHLEHPLDRSRRAPDAGGARVSARHRHERRDARDPGQCDPVARAVAESRWRHNRGEVVQPYAGDRGRGNVAARAVPLLHRSRQQPRLVRVYPGGDAAHRGFAVQRVASPDCARHSPDGLGGRASVSAALSRPSRAEHRSAVDRWGQRVGQRYGVGARVTGEDRHLDQLDVRCLDAGAGLSALPRRGTHSVGDRERGSRVAGGHSLRPSRGALARLQSARALVELHQSVARRPLDDPRHRLVSDRRRLRIAGPCRQAAGALALELPHRRGARRARLARVAVRIRHPRATGLGGAQRAAWNPAPRRRRNPHRAAELHAAGSTSHRRELRHRDAAAVCVLRQDVARGAALSRPPAVSGWPAGAALRRHGAHPPAADGCHGDRGE